MLLRSWAFVVLAAALLASCDAPAEGDDGPPGGGQPVVCLPGQLACPSGCVDATTNPQHCGACGVACAPGMACEAGACRDVCGSGLGFCGGQCVSLQSAGNCGTCGNACQGGQLCVGGACSATCPGSVCSGASGAECVSLSDDENHCGACNHACAPTDACVGGQCVIDCGALTACDGACVDVLSDGAHCGSCALACSGGKACVQGACACPTGKQACGETCVDTALDPAHCGGCDQACVVGGLCEAGKCLGPDGCTDTPVSGLALSAVDVYQSVQVPIMEAGAAIATGTRNADLVAARKALFRVHVTPEAGWTAREVSARVELTHVDAPTPEQRELYFATVTASKPSSDGDPSSTFQVLVPAEAITTDTRYAVTLVECAGAAALPAAGMTTAAARFPSTGYQPLEARTTGPLKVHIIPIGNPGPDVSEAGLKAFKERLEAVYPITEVVFTVGEPLAGTGAGSMCEALATIGSIRSQDAPTRDIYYFGLTPGILGGQSGCSNASTMGSKTSIGWAQGFTPDDGSTGAATMCHELGHAHGRLHAPCNVSDPDSRYPYPSADIGVWGYDFRSDEFYDPMHQDMMSYCPEPRWKAWISDYTYQAILNRVAEVNGQPELPDGALALERAAPALAWQVLVSDSAGVHWVPEPLLVSGTPEGTPVSVVVHAEHGALQQVTGYQQALDDGVSQSAFMLLMQEPDAGWQAIEVPGLLALQRL